MDKEQLYSSGLLEMYVLGLTDEEESAQVEALAAEHPDVQEEIEAMQNALERYAMSHAIPPPDRPENREGAGPNSREPLESGRGHTPTVSTPPPRRWISLAAGFILLASSIYFFQQHRRSEGRLTALKKDYIELDRDCKHEKEQLLEAQQAIAFIQKAHTQPLILEGSQLAPRAFATAYWNEREKAVLLCMNGMPAPPKGKQYQAWADVEGKMVSMGVLEEKGQTALQRITFIPHAESVNITLEPEGGSTKPTVALLYANAALPEERF